MAEMMKVAIFIEPGRIDLAAEARTHPSKPYAPNKPSPR